MKAEKTKSNQNVKNTGKIYMILLIALSFIIIFSMNVKSESGAPPPGPGDSTGGGPYFSEQNWKIQEGDDIYRSNQTIVLGGNLIIYDGGKLTFNNVTLIMNCTTDGEYYIEVQNGGEFNILDNDNNPKTTDDTSNITSADPEFEYLINIRNNAKMTFKNSELHECGYAPGKEGLIIESNNVIIEQNLISNNFYGIYYKSCSPIILNNMISDNVDTGIKTEYTESEIVGNSIIGGNDGLVCINSEIKLINNTISDSIQNDIYLDQDSFIDIINTTFSENKVHFDDETSTISVKLYLTIEIINKLFEPITNANVRVTDLEGNEIYNGDSNEGVVRDIECINFIENKTSKKIYTPHTIIAEKGGLIKSLDTVVNQTKVIQIFLSNDWIVTEKELYEDQVIILNGNLTILKGGELTFKNVTLIMNCSYDGQYHIEIKEGGAFYIQESSHGISDLTIGEQYGRLFYFENTGTGKEPIWTDVAMFSGIDVGGNCAPVFTDLDNDGDFDLTVGNTGNQLFYFKNSGNNEEPEWTEDNTMFEGVTYGSYASPTLIDLDDDGDWDLIIGNSFGDLKYYENTGTAKEPVWEEDTSVFSGIDVGMYSKPTFIDLDDDGDFDLTIGEYYSKIYYYENTGNSTEPEWAENASMFSGIEIGANGAPTFADLDNDGDFDLVIGNFSGMLNYYENIGTKIEPEWSINNILFFGVKARYYSQPDFVDLDNDGDFDLILGNYDGDIFYFENIGSKEEPVWKSYKMYTDVGVSSTSAPALADLDNDGDFDLTIGDYNGFLHYYENIANEGDRKWLKDYTMFSDMDMGGYANPTFIDLDSDGDNDLIIGNSSGYLIYYENTGTPEESEWTINSQMFLDIKKGLYFAPTFTDLDNDGDFDCAFGNYSGHIFYYENTGNAMVPEWSEDPTMFQGIDVGSYSVPTFADLDSDRDYDLTIGNYDGILIYYENTGTPENAEWTVDSTMFAGISVGMKSVPAFADLGTDSTNLVIIEDIPSKIFTNNSNKFTFWIESGAKFEMKNSEINNCGYDSLDIKNTGLWINSDNITIKRSVLSNNYNGIIFNESKNNNLFNITIKDSENYDIILNNSKVTILNSSFNKSKTHVEGQSSLIVKWFLDVKVVDALGNPLIGINITINDKNEKEIFKEETKSNAIFRRIVCTEYEENETQRKYFTPHTIFGEGYKFSNQINVTMNKTKEVILTPQSYGLELSCEINEIISNPGEEIEYYLEVINIGSNPDTITFSIEKPNDWDLTLNKTKVSLSILENIKIKLVVKISEDAVLGMTYDINLTGNSENSTASNFIILKTIIGQTDLIPVGLKFFRKDGIQIGGLTEKHPIQNEITTINITIENIGNTFTEPVNISFYDNNNKIGEITIGNIPSLERSYGEIIWSTSDVQSHEIKVYIDPEDKIKESNEDNNIYSEDLFVNSNIPSKSFIFWAQVNYNWGSKNKVPDAPVTIKNLRTEEIISSNRTNESEFKGKCRFEISESKYLEGDILEIIAMNPDIEINQENVPEGTYFNETSIIIYSEDSKDDKNDAVPLRLEPFGLIIQTDLNKKTIKITEAVKYSIFLKIAPEGNDEEIVNLDIPNIPDGEYWTIILNGEGVSNIDNNYLKTVGREYEEINLILIPPDEDDLSNYNLETELIASMQSYHVPKYSLMFTTKIEKTNITMETEIYEKNVDPGDKVKYNIKITNKGSITDKISLVFEGENSKWVSLSDSIISIQSSDYLFVDLSVDVPIDAKYQDNAEIYLYAISIDGKISTPIILKINVNEKRRDINLTIELINSNGYQSDYEIGVINVGELEEFVTLEVNAPKTWNVKLSFKNLILGIGEQTLISLSLFHPQEAKYWGEENDIYIKSFYAEYYENIIINKPPYAGIALTYEDLVENKLTVDSKIIANASFSLDENLSSLKYEWDFGDGSKSIKKNPSHSYMTAGDFVINLTLEDENGLMDITSRDVKIVNYYSPDIKVSYPLNLDLNLEEEIIVVEINETFILDASESFDKDGFIVNFTWEFENEILNFGELITWSYGAVGDYYIILTVNDNYGKKKNLAIEVKVVESVTNLNGTDKIIQKETISTWLFYPIMILIMFLIIMVGITLNTVKSLSIQINKIKNVIGKDMNDERETHKPQIRSNQKDVGKKQEDDKFNSKT